MSFSSLINSPPLQNLVCVLYSCMFFQGILLIEYFPDVCKIQSSVMLKLQTSRDLMLDLTVLLR